jgi:hypothetical protein
MNSQLIHNHTSSIDHPHQPEKLSKQKLLRGFFTEFQVKRAAGLVSSMLEFKSLLDSDKLPPDLSPSSGRPLCMNQYKNLFGTCRVPGKTEDSLYGVHGRDSGSQKREHIIVMARDQIYSVPVVRSDGSQASPQDLETLLYAVTRDSLSSQVESTEQQRANLSIGLLTADHRNNWAQAYTHLRNLSEQNANSLDMIQSSLFVLALDDKAERAAAAVKRRSRTSPSAHQIFFHRGDARNRWFDKTLQLIVASNGRAGFNVEVSRFIFI